MTSLDAVAEMMSLRAQIEAIDDEHGDMYVQAHFLDDHAPDGWGDDDDFVVSDFLEEHAEDYIPYLEEHLSEITGLVYGESD